MDEIEKEPWLKDVFADRFLIGVALNRLHLNREIEADNALIDNHFNSITAENAMKWSTVNPREGEYDFDLSDKFVQLGVEKNMFVVGHTLIWHEQTPGWVFENSDGSGVDRDTLLGRMRDHIFTVVGRYKGKVNAWDVVNEAISSNGKVRKTIWQRIIGDDFIEKAFEFVHEVDPQAELYYNDYNIWRKQERKGVIRLIKRLRKKGIRIDGVGIQGHWDLDFSAIKELEKSIKKIAKYGVKVMITELDITVLPKPDKADIVRSRNCQPLSPYINPYPDGLPETVADKLSGKYYELFKLFVKHSDKISRVTFWGVHDKYSWHNYWPILCRVDYPLLFDRECRPKRAFDAVVKAARE